jgi:integrase/recombinase XerD
MTFRMFTPRTQEGYVHAVKGFGAFLGVSPDTARFEDLRRYQLHLVSSGAGVPTIDLALTALRLIFTVTLRKPEIVVYLPFFRKAPKLPVVLSLAEVTRLLNAEPGRKYKAVLSDACRSRRVTIRARQASDTSFTGVAARRVGDRAAVHSTAKEPASS